MEKVAVFGDEEEHEAVDEPEDLAVVVVGGELAVAEPVAQRRVGGMRQESAAEGGDGPFEAGAEPIECSHALLAGLLDPPLEPAVCWLVGFEAALVAGHPQDGEVSEDLVREHRLEVELDVGGSGQAGVVPKEPEAPAVGEDCPEVVLGAVEELLGHGERRRAGRAGDASGAAVELDVGAEEVDGDRPPQ
ncbi:MAG: hypothetical protein M0T80_14260, partial [Actinomycetota bacterium]|nr:hypothetical protein [Actinomycetota bacterium]